MSCVYLCVLYVHVCIVCTCVYMCTCELCVPVCIVCTCMYCVYLYVLCVPVCIVSSCVYCVYLSVLCVPVCTCVYCLYLCVMCILCVPVWFKCIRVYCVYLCVLGVYQSWVHFYLEYRLDQHNNYSELFQSRPGHLQRFVNKTFSYYYICTYGRVGILNCKL